ncbi:MAG: 3-deoxy-manno-octulosonate cytidylyltransferase, partial [Pseudomonadota bacterium]
MKTLIVIPSRWASTRFPQKPLHQIAGKSLLARVAEIAEICAKRSDNVSYVIATDHEAIEAHAQEIGAPVVMTDPKLPSGTDRALAAASIAAPD